MMDKLNTKDIMLRKHWHVEGGPACVMCDHQMLDTRDHIFFQCSFVANCWDRVGVHWDCSLNISDRFASAR
jgi:hypothetical protein